MLVNLLFNSIGYRIISNVLEKKANPSKLIEIKIPFKSDYVSEWKHFENFKGDIEIEGKHYKYVKRKVIESVK